MRTSAAFTAISTLVRLLDEKGLIQEREYWKALACAAVAAKHNGQSTAGDELMQYVAQQG